MTRAPSSPPVSDPGFWDALYAGGETDWDLRRPTPVLERVLTAGNGALPGEPPAGRAAVPGCGRGFDARLLARYGFPTWGFDFAAAAVEEARRLAAGEFVAAGPAPAPVVFEQRDVFTLADAYPAFFDLVWEYTSFCAVDPARRAEYVDVLRRVLRPGGRLLALFFPVDVPPWRDGPPFPARREEIRRLLEPAFRIDAAEVPEDSVPKRAGLEWLVRACPR